MEKNIIGYNGDYTITDKGKVFSLKYNKRIEMKQSPDLLGYMRLRLTKNNVGTTKKVHRLVAEAFIENPNNKQTVNHKNGIKNDNRIENLEWATISENNQHAYDTGLNENVKKGTIEANIKPIKVIDTIDNSTKIFESIKSAATFFQSSGTTIGTAFRRNYKFRGRYLIQAVN
jgi:hypothetical protein